MPKETIYSSAKLYKRLGISVCYNPQHSNKREKYLNTVIYMTGATLAFDYLANGFIGASKRIPIKFDTVIVDEIDYILLDNAVSKFNMSVSQGNEQISYSSIYSRVYELINTFTRKVINGKIICYDMYILEQEYGYEVDYICCPSEKDILINE